MPDPAQSPAPNAASRLTVLTVVGTRPEAIKMAPVLRALRSRPERFRSLLCVTGQHREMLAQVLPLFELRPDVDLGLMRPDQALAELTAALFASLDRVVQEARPDWILAQGDTTSVMVAGLVAFYRRVRFGHVEAGLRTGDRHAPFPEEVNRRIADLVADAYFAPTARARDALLAEGCPAPAVHVTGNTVIDALQHVAALPYDWAAGPLRTLPAEGRLVLVTAHRRESFGEPFRQLCLAIRELAVQFPGIQFVYPVHLNPNVRRPVAEILGTERGAGSAETAPGPQPSALSPQPATLSPQPSALSPPPSALLPNLHLLPPLPYLDLVQLMKRCTLILTDSGGIQEEAPALRVPVLVMRDTTERPEGVEAGVVRLVGTQRDRIVAEAARLLSEPAARAAMATGASPYGDGRAAERIVAVLAETGG